MTILEILKKFGSSYIHFTDGTLSYGEIASSIRPMNDLFKWDGIWNKNNFIALMSAMASGVPVVCSVVDPDEKLRLKHNEIAFRTSGTEGEPKWIIHPYSHFLIGESLTLEAPVAALLFPAHAAGFDFIFHCLRQGAEFTFCKLQNVNDTVLPKTIFGPPQALASLMFFAEKNKSVLRQLDSFYVSADALPPSIVEKARKLNLAFKIKQFYGSTETMMIWVEENNLKPWLFRFRNGEIREENDNVYYAGKTLGTNVSEPFLLSVVKDNEWFSHIDSKRNITKVWGHTLNLKRIENALLAKKEILDVKVEVSHSGVMGSALTIHLWTTEVLKRPDIESFVPELKPLHDFTVLVHPPESLSLEKKKRIVDGKNN